MKTIIEIDVKSEVKPSIRHLGGTEYEITLEHTHKGNPSRVMWVRTWNPDDLQRAKDGKGFSVSPRRKLKQD